MFNENTLLLLRVFTQTLRVEIEEGLINIEFIKKGWFWNQCIGSVSMFERGDECNKGFIYHFYGYPATNDTIVNFLRRAGYNIIISNTSDFPVKC